MRTTETDCGRSDLGCEQRICVAINLNTIAADAFAVRKIQKWLPRTKNRPRATKNRAAQCKRPACGLFRSRFQRKCVGKFTNAVAAHLSQFKTLQTDCKRTHSIFDFRLPNVGTGPVQGRQLSIQHSILHARGPTGRRFLSPGRRPGYRHQDKAAA